MCADAASSCRPTSWHTHSDDYCFKLANCLACAQAAPGVEPARVNAPPFSASVKLPAPKGPLRVAIQLRFTEAADPDYRQASLEYVAQLSAEQRPEPASGGQNGTARGVQRHSPASPAAGYATRSTAQTDTDVLVCDHHQVVTFVTQRQVYSLLMAPSVVGLDKKPGDKRTTRAKRQRR